MLLWKSKVIVTLKRMQLENTYGYTHLRKHHFLDGEHKFFKIVTIFFSFCLFYLVNSNMHVTFTD